MSNISSVNRLRMLPKVFHGQDLALKTGLKPHLVSLYLQRWKKEGLIEGLGGRSDIFYNALCYPHESWVEDAVLDLYPGAIQTGASVLHRDGWTTQIPNKIDVAVPPRSGHGSPYVRFTVRPIRWFRVVQEGLMDKHLTVIPSLRPAWALADSWMSKDPQEWRPDPDDLDFFEMEAHAKDFLRAIRSLQKLRSVEIDLPGTLDTYEMYMALRLQMLDSVNQQESLWSQEGMEP